MNINNSSSVLVGMLANLFSAARLPRPAAAQTGLAAGALEEVLVTAQRRTGLLEKVPMAISVSSGNSMDRADYPAAMRARPSDSVGMSNRRM